MTAKERFFTALAMEPVDRTPAYVLDGNSWVANEEGLTYKEIFELEDVGASLWVKRYDEIQSDVIFAGTSCWLAWTNTFGAPVNVERVGRTIDVEPCVVDLENDIPDLSDEELKAKLSENYYVRAMMKQIVEVKKLIGEEKPVAVALAGPFTSAATMLGTGEFLKQIAKRNKKLPALEEFAARCLKILVDFYMECGADFFLLCEPTSSGDMIAPRTFKQHVVPYFASVMEHINGRVPVLFHICGKAGVRLEEAIALGVKGFSVDSMVDLEEMLQKAEKKLCIMGNLSPSEQMVQGTPESVYAEATRLLDLAKANGGGFLLSTGCDFPAKSPAANARAMVQAAIDHAQKA